MLKLRDNLWSRILEDHFLFFVFAIGGAVGIIAAKLFSDWSMEAIACFAIALMLLYAFLVSSKGIGKLRADQAGDNCYYLGLIYTLTSLGHAIFTYDSRGSSNEIVNGFGVALATTILGLVLRVGFNQSRLDIHEIEGQARLELVEAAAEMKTKLGQVTELIGGLGEELRQSMDDMRRATEEGVEQASGASISAIEKLAETAGDKLRNQVDEFRAEVAELTKGTTKSKKALEGHAEALAAVTREQTESAEHLSKINNAVERAAALSEEMHKQQVSLEQYSGTVASSTELVSRMTADLENATMGAVSAIASATDTLDNAIKSLKTGPSTAVTSAVETVQKATEQLEAAIEGVANRYEAAGQAIQNSTSGVVTALGSHNAALEQELEKSRANVAKVHSALVDMTDSLRDQVSKAEIR